MAGFGSKLKQFFRGDRTPVETRSFKPVPEQLAHNPVAQETDWEPNVRDDTNFRTHRLVYAEPNPLVVKGTACLTGCGAGGWFRWGSWLLRRACWDC